MFTVKGLLNNLTISRYLFNSSWMIADQLLRLISGVFVGIYIARYLGPEQFGLLSYVVSLSAFILSISRLGMDAVLVRELVNNPEKHNRLLGTAFWLMILSALICYIIAGIGILLSNETTQIKIFAYIVFASAFFTPFMVTDYFFQSQVKAKYSAICKLFALLFMSMIKLGLILTGAELFKFIIASLLDHVMLAVFLMISIGKVHGFKFLSYFSWHDAKEMLKSSWPMVLSSIAVLIYMRIDQIMIRYMLGLHDVGIYSAAMKIYDAWITFPYTITVSFLPAIVKLKQGHEAIYYKRLTQLFKYMIWLCILAAIIVTLVSEPLIVIAFGAEYRDSSSVLNIVMWTAVFVSMGSVSARYFNVEKMEKKIALRTILAALINISLNLLLIPKYGIKGAAIATLVGTFFSNYFMDWFDKDLKNLLRIKHRAMFLYSFK